MPRLLSLLDRLVELIACTLIAILLGVVSLGVVYRSLDDPLIWTDEIARFLMVWLAVFGWILACRHRSHVRIRFFQDLLPKPAWRAAEFTIQFALLIFGVAIAVYGWNLTSRSVDLEATTVPISFAWMYAPMVLAGIVTALQALGELLEVSKRPVAASPVNESVVE